MVSKIQLMATEYHVGAASWAAGSLGIGDRERALDFLVQSRDTKRGGEGFIALAILAGNALSDPVLEQPEFVEASHRLGLIVDFRTGSSAPGPSISARYNGRDSPPGFWSQDGWHRYSLIL
jgi:hypothetical protein